MLAALVLTACGGAADDAPADSDVETDVGPRCGGLDEPCAAIATRPTTRTCGANLDLSDPLVRPWPEHASELGCFEQGDIERPGPDLVPYDVVAPLWSQGAHKRRWVVLPPGAQVGFRAEGEWAFPEGTLLIKVFEHDVVEDGATTRRPIEVRFMAREATAWSFATYRWDPALGDGVLEDAIGETVSPTVRVDGQEHPISWWIPGLEGCEVCHRGSAAEALGPRADQLDRDLDYGDLTANQLVAWWSAGLLDARPTVSPTSALVDPYGPADVERRARSWLHANCAHCHQPGGFVSPDILLDLRVSTPAADMHACGVKANGAWELDADTVIVAGDPDASQLVRRLETTGPSKMPPDGATLADEAGIAAVRAWIGGLDRCP